MAKPKLSQRINGASTAKPPATPPPTEGLVEDPDASVVDRFIAEHPEPIVDSADAPLVEAPTLVQDGPVEPGAVPGATAPVEPEPTEPVAPTEPPSTETPVAEPPAEGAVAPPVTPVSAASAAPAAPVAPVAAVVEAPKPAATPVYDPNEKFALGPDAEWTREQIITRLQEYQQQAPVAQEADKFRKLLDFDSYDKAEAQWKPVLEIMRAEPERTKFLDQVLHADTRALQYLVDSLEFWRQGIANGTIEAPAATRPQPAASLQPSAKQDPQLAEALKFIAREKVRAAETRAKSEYRAAFEAYPFLREDRAALEGLRAMANALYNEDRAKGIDDLDCRGISAAVDMMRGVYDATMIARQAATAPAVAAPPAAPAAPNPAVAAAAAATLGTSGPAPSARRAIPKVYTGDPEEAVTAFVRDFPKE